MRSPRASIATRSPSASARRTSPASPNVTTSRSSRRWGSSSGSSAGTMAVPPARMSRSAPPWPRRPPPASPAARGGPGPTLTMMPTSGRAIAVSSAICSAPRIAISSTSASVPAGAPRIASGRPISVLKLAGLATVATWGASRAARMSLVDVLPVEPGDADHAGVQRVAPRPGQPLQRGQRLVGREQHAGRRAARRLGRVGRDDGAPRARGERLGREAATVLVLAPQADEQVAGPGLARVDDRPLRPGRSGRRRRDEPRARGRGDALRRPVPHRATAPPRASRTTATSSNGSLRPPSNSWPCSWPLPAIDDHVAGGRQPDRARDRLAAIHQGLARRAGARERSPR